MTDKKNILLVHNYYQLPGGEDTVVNNEKKMLENHGYNVFLYTRDNKELQGISLIGKISFAINFLFNFRTFVEVRKIIKQCNIDLVHVHNTLSLVSPSVYYAALSKKIPVVKTIHNFRLVCPNALFYRDGNICEDCITKGLHSAIKHKCYRNSRIQTIACVLNLKIHRFLGIYKKLNYICLTEFNRKKLLSVKGISPNNVYIKPNFTKANDRYMPLRERMKKFIYVGRIEKIKGIDILLNAWCQLEDKTIELLMYGTGPEQDWCEEFIKENHLNIKMMGYIDNDKIKDQLAESIDLIFPSKLYEGFPMVITEAFSVGTPVIASKIGNAKYIVDNGVNGILYETDNHMELANIVQYYGNIVTEEMCLAAKEKYKNCYSMESNYKILNDIYNNVIRGNIINENSL